MSVRTFRSSVLTPRERGAELGRTFPGEIAACVDAYRKLFGVADLGPLGEQALAAIEAVSPALADEIAGIAAGSGRTAFEIAAINARTEILAYLRVPGRGECSTVVKISPDGRRPIAVQAWDWYESLADSWFVWEIPHPDGSVTTTLTEFGIVGKIGVNRSGLGVLFNILHHEADGATIGAPVHVLARAVLDTCTDLNQALVLLAAAPVSASSSLTLVAARDDESAAVSVELNPVKVGYALPDAAGLLTHTNHFLSSPGAAGDTELITGPDTVVRLDLLRRRLTTPHPATPHPSPATLHPDPTSLRPAPSDKSDLSVGVVLSAMDSHLLGGGGLCCHPDETLPPSARFRTLATVVLDVAGGTLSATPGGPCTHPLRSQPQSKEIDMPLVLKRIDNMDILTKDVGRLVEFYHGLLGLPFHLPYVAEEEWAAIDLGNLTLYIFKSEVGEHAPRRTAVNPDNAPGYDSMAFEVNDLDEAEAALDGKVEWVDERIEWKHPNGTWYRYRPFFDPDGNMLYVTEPHQASA